LNAIIIIIITSAKGGYSLINISRKEIIGDILINNNNNNNKRKRKKEKGKRKKEKEEKRNENSFQSIL
jgi:hypothetical protein